MANKIVVNGREFRIQAESPAHYHVMDYAPDGETAEFIVSKQHCIIGEQGELLAEQFELEAYY